MNFLLNDELETKETESLKLIQDTLNLCMEHKISMNEIMDFYRQTYTAMSLSDSSPMPKFLGSVLLDFIWIIHMEISCSNMAANKKNERMNFLLDLLSNLLQTQLISSSSAIERLEPELLEAVGLINSEAFFKKRIIKLNTSMFYRQQKYNLIREESEGYAKLLVEISKHFNNKSNLLHQENLLEIVTSLVGYFSLDPNRVLDLVLDVASRNIKSNHAFFIQFMNQSSWVSTKNEMSSQSLSSLLAALLGMKFQNYSRIKKKERIMDAENLYLVAAVLVRNGLLDPKDLYPYLSPNGESSENAFSELMNLQRKKSRKNTVASSLLDISLPDDKPSSSPPAEAPQDNEENKQKDEIPEETIIQNQVAKFCHALFACGCYAHGLDIFLSDINLCHFEPQIATWICKYINWIIDPLFSKVKQAEITKGSLKDNEMDLENDCVSQIEYIREKKYCSGLSKNFLAADELSVISEVPQISTISSFFDDIAPLLKILGGYLSSDTVLASKICKIAETHLESEKNSESWNETSKFWQDIVVEVLFPSLCLSSSCVSLNYGVWHIVQKFSYEIRYFLYGEWKYNVYKKHPELLSIKISVTSEMKKIMRRISKDNVKQFGRKIGKISHNNPLICFPIMLEQLQVYENLISVAVDCFRYCSQMGLDILAYTLIQTLANPMKPRLKPDGTNIAVWLSSLAVFSGKLFFKHPTIELTGILNYILSQGKDGNPFDLVILKELITQMSGTVQLTEGASELQLKAMGGGTTLKKESLGHGTSFKFSKTSDRLAQALLSSGLAKELLILLGKQRSSSIYHSEIEHLKLLSSLFDHVQETVLQYVDFVSANVDDAIYREKITPNIKELLQKYGMESDISWFVYRRVLSIDAFENESAKKNALDEISNLHEKEFWNNFSPKFYFFFWRSSLYDLEAPLDVYDLHIQHQKTYLDSLGEVSDVTKPKIIREIQKTNLIVENLENEKNHQIKVIERTLEILKQECKQWFADVEDCNSLVNHIVKRCLRRRVTFSATDAIFCAKFLFLMHSSGTTNFSLLETLNCIFSEVSLIIFTASQNEANHYGRFLYEILQTVNNWYSNEVLYHESTTGLPGFKTSFQSAGIQPEDILKYNMFKNIMFKWHEDLLTRFMECLDTDEYIRIRNTIVILDRITKFFPKVIGSAEKLEEKLQTMLSNEKREDLKVLLTRYDAALKKCKKTCVKREVYLGICDKDSENGVGLPEVMKFHADGRYEMHYHSNKGKNSTKIEEEGEISPQISVSEKKDLELDPADSVKIETLGGQNATSKSEPSSATSYISVQKEDSKAKDDFKMESRSETDRVASSRVSSFRSRQSSRAVDSRERQAFSQRVDYGQRGSRINSRSSVDYPSRSDSQSRSAAQSSQTRYSRQQRTLSSRDYQQRDTRYSNWDSRLGRGSSRDFRDQRPSTRDDRTISDSRSRNDSHGPDSRRGSGDGSRQFRSANTSRESYSRSVSNSNVGLTRESELEMHPADKMVAQINERRYQYSRSSSSDDSRSDNHSRDRKRQYYQPRNEDSTHDNNSRVESKKRKYSADSSDKNDTAKPLKEVRNSQEKDTNSAETQKSTTSSNPDSNTQQQPPARATRSSSRLASNTSSQTRTPPSTRSSRRR